MSLTLTNNITMENLLRDYTNTQRDYINRLFSNLTFYRNIYYKHNEEIISYKKLIKLQKKAINTYQDCITIKKKIHTL